MTVPPNVVRECIDRFLEELPQGQVAIGIFETEKVGRCLYANPSWSGRSGLSPEAARGTDWTTMISG